MLVPAGAVALAAWVSALGARSRWVLLAAFAGFTTAATASHFAWARYHEPFLLLFAAIASALIVSRTRADGPQGRPGSLLGMARIAGPIVHGLLLAAVTAQKMLTLTPVTEPLAVQEGRPTRHSNSTGSGPRTGGDWRTRRDRVNPPESHANRARSAAPSDRNAETARPPARSGRNDWLVSIRPRSEPMDRVPNHPRPPVPNPNPRGP